MLSLLLLVLASSSGPAVYEWVVREVDEPVHRLQGTTLFREPLPGVEITVYDSPDVILRSDLKYEEMRSRQRILQKVVSDKRGRFKVKRLPPGRYELYFRKEGWNPLSLIVTVVPHSQKVETEYLEVELPIGG
jgi:hypothetical protein